MKKTYASWISELWATCPYCEESQEIEFSDIDEWWLKLGNICESKEDINHKHICEECGKEFLISETVW